MRKKNKSQKGFTLIELLVAIAIIGILANLILISFKDSKKKAEIAKVLQWSNSSIYHMLGANSMGIWRFNGDLNDASGNENNCDTYDNNENLIATTYVNGIAGQGVDFDGSTYLNCGDDGSLNPMDEVTIEAWVYRKGSGSGVRQGIVQKYNNDNYMIEYNSTDGKIKFWLECAHVDSDLELTLETWTHVAAVKGSSNEMRLYINGVKQGTVPDPTCSQDLISAEDFNIGRYRAGGGYFEGIIDEVRIYSEGFSKNIAREHYLKGKLTHK